MSKIKKLGLWMISAIIMISAAGCAKSAETTAPVAEKDFLETIKENGVLKVGTEGTYPPFTYHDDADNLVGYDVEIAQAIGEALGVEVEFVETKWDAMIAGLDAKRYDIVVNQVSITEERQQKYDFSIPYTISKAVLIVRAEEEAINSFETLAGKKSAQSLTSNFAKTAEKYGAELVGTDGFNQSIELVISKRADATINDDVTFYDYLKQKPDAQIKIVASEEDASKSAVLIRKGNDTFVKAVNEALEKLQADGTIKAISEKYFGADISK
ncbi:amino acid ABC transporter substrate-binding protein [Cellulosilyticum sp. I15G10I2]|uniref:amino acid ABC transporter substrate-binding protein n=1 Tax=Cellulosilyticum sp. I15G10I2 TaxID=1892843 RepID=UPI000A67DA44|nr:amino acid ABC transporter substrate-binding protein [Cellulosilyticum sp. I15G10I2]